MHAVLPEPVEQGGDRLSRRIGDLSVLPVFFPLAGREVLLAGGSAAAAWKAELLASAGADVVVYAERPEKDLEDLLARSDYAGRFILVRQPWCETAFKGKAFAVADLPDDGAAQAFFYAAKAAGVPVNVIDQPAFCDFQFGSIVNRSPVVIGISTNGAAPILGQAIRRKIETLIPVSLASWGAYASRIRARVQAELLPGRERRRFWEKLSKLAFSEDRLADGGNQEADLFAAAREGASKQVGSVILVGAGPGDAELLTLKAVRALQGADVILFDDLVDGSVLELARREARRMLVGKRGGRESCRQEDINELMVRLARQGKTVVRLKAGDPVIFGRAGEEIEQLEKEGIPVSVVPGITAASAMAAQIGVSLTHRDSAQSVRFVTGHSRNGDLPETIDWTGLADPATTTVFYMERGMAGRISQRLIAAGQDADTPVCVVADVARPGTLQWTGALANLAAGVKSLNTSAPVLIGIGWVFGKTHKTAFANSAGGVPDCATGAL